jgi:hypothetical protein
MLSRNQMAEIVRPYSTVSDRIRALDAAGVARADIARFLERRYQHVRNVLEGDKQKGGYVLGHADLSGVQDQGEAFGGPVDEAQFVQARSNGLYRLVVRPDGSILLPKAVREAFDVEGGGVVMAQLEGEEFTVISTDTALRQAQALVRKYIPAGQDLAASLIEDRRREAAAEEADD